MVWLVATAWAGAWVQDPGHGYGKVGGSVFQGAEASYAGVGIYAEVGLPAGFQALVSVPLGVGTQPRGGVVYRRWAAGDARVGVARRLLPTVSASFLAKIPLYGDPDLAAYGALAERFPRPGDGQVDLDLRVDGGRSLRLGGVDGWAQGGVGWRHRDGAPTDGILASGEVGLGGQGFALLRASVVVDPVADPETRQGLTVGVGAGVGSTVRVEGWIDDTRLASPDARGTGGGLGVS